LELELVAVGYLGKLLQGNAHSASSKPWENQGPGARASGLDAVRHLNSQQAKAECNLDCLDGNGKEIGDGFARSYSSGGQSTSANTQQVCLGRERIGHSGLSMLAV